MLRAYWERLKGLGFYAPAVLAFGAAAARLGATALRFCWAWIQHLIANPPDAKRAATVLTVAVATLVTSFWLYGYLAREDIPAESTATVMVAPMEDNKPVSALVVPQAPTPTSASAHRKIPDDRSGITRALQAELRRVGCYEGQVNGIWTASSRAAMKSFTERVNAALPVDQPDQILLALVQAHRDKVCIATCPDGQVPGGWGRCQPDPSLAKTSQQTASISAGSSLETSSTSQASSTAGRSATVTVAKVEEEELDTPRAPVGSATAAPAALVQKPARPPASERRASRNHSPKKSFQPPAVARAVMKSLKNLQRALGGF